MLNRRHIIGGAAALPAAVIVSCVATSAMARTLSPEFAALIDTAEASLLAASTHYNEVYLPNVAAAAKACDANPSANEADIQQINAGFGITREGKCSDSLWYACSSAQSAVAAHPVDTAADLAAKLAFMVQHHMGDGMDWLKELHADARRVAKLEDAA